MRVRGGEKEKRDQELESLCTNEEKGREEEDLGFKERNLAGRKAGEREREREEGGRRRREGIKEKKREGEREKENNDGLLGEGKKMKMKRKDKRDR